MNLTRASLSLFVSFACSVHAEELGSQKSASKIDRNWQVSSSVSAGGSGAQISRSAFVATGWHATAVPSTVAGALIESQGLPDPYYSMNLRAVPGTTYPVEKDFYHLELPADSPFNVPWWYRTLFDVQPVAENEHIFIRFNGINYAANIWLNGQKIADQANVIGSFRQFEFEITKSLSADGHNAVAAEVFVQHPDSLAPSWVDWNPMPGDKNMGLWRSVELFRTGAIRLKNTSVISAINLPAATVAHLTIKSTAVNLSDHSVSTSIEGEAAGQNFSRSLKLRAHQTKTVAFQLKVPRPKLWWPRQMGQPYLYQLKIAAKVRGLTSDTADTRFGIREISSHLIADDSRVFTINGKRLFIRGGGWAPDLFLKSSDDRERKELNYVADLNLNTIRFEGKFETDHFLDLADEMGMLTMPGWACCTQWEYGVHWKKKDFEIAEASFRDQLRRHINHPSTLVWLYGSDYAPPAEVEKMYLRVMKEEGWPNPSVASAREDDTLVGKTGVKMTGPYDYVPPAYWYIDDKHGGAFGFNTETSVGPSVPPIESIMKMLPAEHLWPIDDYWNYHTGVDHFQQIKYFTEAMERRYDGAHSLQEYAMKAQVLAYDGHRAMYEAYASEKYKKTTGVIQWMLNNAWPSMIWHLYDYYLRPGGSYFGAKKALEPVHIQYGYDDASVSVVNSTYSSLKGLSAEIQLYDFSLKPLLDTRRKVDIGADAVKKIFVIGEQPNLTKTYFIRLTLTSEGDEVLSHNFYWLSTQHEKLEWKKTDFTHTPTLVDADMKMLNTLPAVEVEAKAKGVTMKGEKVSDGTQDSSASIKLVNKGSHLAFSVRLKLTADLKGEEILPVFWQDNYLTLMPGESRTIAVRYAAHDLGARAPYLEVSGWNLTPMAPIPVEP